MVSEAPTAGGRDEYDDDHESCFPIETSHPIISKWHLVEPDIADVLSRLPYATLSLVRRGAPLKCVDNPVTVLVGASENTKATWSGIVDDISTILARSSLSEISVVVNPVDERYSIPPSPESSGKLLSVEDFDFAVGMGASFAPEHIDASATIGGTIFIQYEKSYVRLFMSAFHPFLGVVKERLQFEGFVPKNENRSFPIVMPSKPDTQRTLLEFHSMCKLKREQINDAEQKFEGTKEDRYLKILNDRKEQLEQCEACCEQIVDFTSNRIAGYLWACGKFTTQEPPSSKSGKTQSRSNPKSIKAQHQSGLASGKTQVEAGLDTLDWSLIKPASGRMVVNTVPDLDVGRLLSKNQYHPKSNMVQRWSMDTVKAGKLVIKTGRSTGITVGRLTGSCEVILQDPPTKHTVWDIESFSRDKPFLLPGDSGAWAIDMQGNWIGLLFAGSQGSGVMLPVDRLVKDIEDMTMGTLCLPSDPELKQWHDLPSQRTSKLKDGVWVNSR